MDFRSEVERLLRQIPEGRLARCGDVARALGDVRASIAVFRFVADHPGIPGVSRIVSGTGGSAADTQFFTGFDGDAPLEKLRAEQFALAANVSSRDIFRTVSTIGGVDVSYDGDRGFATAVVLRASDLAVVEETHAARAVTFPYIPTYLAQREFPLIRAAFDRLTERPTVLLIDGHGRLHPARCGVACFAGVKLGVPTIGVAKNPLTGTMSRRPAIGESAPVRVGREVLGYAIRTSQSARPLFVSVGHRVSLRTAVRIVRSACITRHPEPLRLAHAFATEFKRRKGKRIRRGFANRSLPQERKPGAKEGRD